MPEPRELCSTCNGSGLIVEAPREGYHIYRQCPDCKGAGYQREIKEAR